MNSFTSSLGVALAITSFCLYLLVTRILQYHVGLPMHTQLIMRLPNIHELLTL